MLVRRAPYLSARPRSPAQPLTGPPALIWILARAADPKIPPFERARLLAAFSQQLDGGAADESATRLPDRLIRLLCAECDRVLHDEVLPALVAAGVAILPWSALHGAERARLRALFRDTIYPLLTPLAVDSTHPFPCIPARSVHVAALVRDHGSTTDRFACVPVRNHLFGFGPFDRGFVWLDAQRLVSVDVVVSTMVDDLFHGMQVVEKSTFRVIPAVDPRPDGIVGPPFQRLELADTTTVHLGEIIRHNLGVAEQAVYRMRPPLGLLERIAAIRATPESGRP